MRWLAVAGIAGALMASPAHAQNLDSINHFVVLVEENNSFDKLYGGWEGVDGLPAVATQTDQFGQLLECLPQTVGPLLSPPLSTTCSGTDAGGKTFTSHFLPGTFSLNGYDLGPADIRHGFYQERYQVNGGRMDRFVVGNDGSEALAMGVWDTRALPLYQYLHSPGAPRYVIADRFFHSAFGGSFLNHQWLVSARTPKWPNPPAAVRAVVDADGMPGTYPGYLMYKSSSAKALRDGQVSAACDGSGAPCGEYVVNTAQPQFQPYAAGVTVRVPALKGPTIGSRLSDAGVSWAWYAQGWSNAAGLKGQPGWTNGKRRCSDPQTRPGARFPYCPNVQFQFHHQGFNYYKAFSPKTAAGRANRDKHLRDYAVFSKTVKGSAGACTLPAVSFVKFMNGDNEHPGAGGPIRGSQATVRLLQSVTGSACGKDTMVIVIYDENGGSWDHVAPPAGDQWGPGTRIPALVVAPGLPNAFAVDHTVHDTTSVIATLQQRFGLKGLPIRPYASLDTVFSAAAP